MNLAELIINLPVRHASGNLDVPVNHVLCDSRKITPGDVFVAVSNVYYDGHQYIQDAIAAGASAIVHSNNLSDDLVCDIPCVRVTSTMEAIGYMCALERGNPSRKMDLVGVTGTNGKTSTCHMIESIMKASGVPTGIIGTTGASYGDISVDTGLTTPEAPELQKILAEMVDAGVQRATVEVSSHGIALKRVLGCHYSAGVFTGLGRDHLDFHANPSEYRETKVNWLLDDVQGCPNVRGVVTPLDDDAGQEIYREFRGRVLSFGFDDDSDIYPEALEMTTAGTRGRVLTPRGTLSLFLQAPGRHNVRNAMAAIGVASLLDIEPIAVVEGLQRFRGAPGRFDSVENTQGLTVLVDYAHTPDALAVAIQSLREITEGRVIVVFGCGGDRDQEKRPEMGAIVAEHADVLVVTSDNPRTESPTAIIDQVIAGIPTSSDAGSVHVEPDRRAAIKQAIELASPGDAVLIAGKGHESKQIIGDEVIAFDDRQVAAEVLQ
jgi:UDP-N-acetylmuramyl-tripeptide synthetase